MEFSEHDLEIAKKDNRIVSLVRRNEELEADLKMALKVVALQRHVMAIKNAKIASLHSTIDKMEDAFS